MKLSNEVKVKPQMDSGKEEMLVAPILSDLKLTRLPMLSGSEETLVPAMLKEVRFETFFS